MQRRLIFPGKETDHPAHVYKVLLTTVSHPYSIRSLERGLAVMRMLSLKGPLSVSDTASETQLPRQTVSRILFFLEDLGFVQRRVSDKRFEIAEQALTLTEGLERSKWIKQGAVPFMEQLCREILWPVSIAQPRGLRMEILWDTDNLSPLVIHPAPAGLRFPFVTSIAGRVFLANSTEKNRKLLIEAVLADDPDALSAVDLSEHMLGPQLDVIREQGFYCDQMPHKAHSSLAAPLFDRFGIKAVLDIRFPSRSLALKEATNDLAPKVKTCAQNISDWMKNNS